MRESCFRRNFVFGRRPRTAGGGGETIIPAVELLNGSVSGNTLSFTISPDKAVACAYSFYPEGVTAPEAEAILASGRQVDAESDTPVVIGDLDYSEDYVILAAAKSRTGHIATSSLTLRTADKFIPTFTQPANCYIVPEAGDYSFYTETSNGSAIEGIAYVDWIWASKSDGSDADQQLLSDIALEDGIVKFTATGNRGNLVLAAFDTAGSIVWSWHIWCTATPETRTFANGKTFMDRNLGATAAAPGSTDSFGLYYQWGRKDPFYGGLDVEDRGKPFTEALKGTVVNPKYGSEWKYLFITEGADTERSIAEPMTFFKADHYYWNSATDDDTLWGTTKTVYDPCPSGYRVPLLAELSDLLHMGEDDFDLNDIGVNYVCNGLSSWFPAQGLRNPEGELECVFKYGYGSVALWTCETTAVERDGMTYHWSKRLLINEWGSLTDVYGGHRSTGLAIRCIAE